MCKCVAEASYTLLLYDELLEWTERPLREFLTYPMQSEWQRKECLHLTIIHNFDRGKVSPSLILRCTPPTINSFMWLIMLNVERSGRLSKNLFRYLQWIKSFISNNKWLMISYCNIRVVLFFLHTAIVWPKLQLLTSLKRAGVLVYNY